VDCLLHDDAVVASGALTVTADGYERVREAVRTQLERIAGSVVALGGVIGHVKASASTVSTEMFSVTDIDEGVSSKTSPELMITINIAAIVFAVEPDAAKAAVRAALEEIASRI
jgi:hypothetical protein